MKTQNIQAVYDAIKSVRLGNTVNVIINDTPFTVEPWDMDKYTNGYCQLVLAKYHRKKIGVVWINWHDAGPNPRLLNLGGFIRRKHIYGVVNYLNVPANYCYW